MELPYVDGKYSIEYVVAPYPLALKGECLGYIFKNTETGKYLGEVRGPNDYFSVKLCILAAPGAFHGPAEPTSALKKDLRPATIKDFERFRRVPPKDFVLAFENAGKDTEIER